MSSKEDQFELIKKAEKKVTRAADGREDMQLMSASHLNCQSMLSTAPMTVAVLGHLTLVTLHKDVDLRRESGSYEKIKYPESLKASTVHLTNEACAAFTLAEKNMDQIRIYTGQVPGHVESAIKILLKGTKGEIAQVMPHYIALLKKTALQCVTKAKEVEEKFIFVEDLTKELQEACSLTQGTHEKKIDRAERTINTRKEEMKASAEKEARIKLERELMKKQIEEAKEKYEEQMKKMPGAAKLIGMGLADGLCKLVSAPGNLVKGIGNLLSGGNRSSGDTSSSSGSHPVPQTDGLESAIGLVTNATKKLMSAVEKGEEIDLPGLMSTFQSELQSLECQGGPAKERLQDLFKTAIEVTTHLMNQEEGDHENIKAELKRLQGMTEATEIFANTLHGGMPMAGSGPKMSKVESTGPLDAYVKQAYYKVEAAENTLRAAQSRYHVMTEKLEREQEHNLNLMTDLANVELDKIDFEEIKQLMQKCLKALADIREQWGKLASFFTCMSNIIETILNDSLTLFTQTLETEGNTALPYGFSDVLIDVIYTQTAEANKIAFMTSDISGMYLSISQKHLTIPLTKLGQLLALDPKKDADDIKVKQEELTSVCEAATREVGRFILQRKEDFDSRIEGRLGRIERDLRAILPPEPEETPEIKREKEQARADAEELRRRLDEDLDQYL